MLFQYNICMKTKPHDLTRQDYSNDGNQIVSQFADSPTVGLDDSQTGTGKSADCKLKKHTFLK